MGAAKKKKSAIVGEVEWKRFRIPIYYSPISVGGRIYESYQIAYYRAGKRVRERRGDLAQMKIRAKEVAEELGGETIVESRFTSHEVKAVNTAAEILAPLDIPITEAARIVVEAEKILGGRGTILEAAMALVEHRESKKLPQITFGDLCEEFMGTLASEGKDAKSRKYHRSIRYWQDCSQRLGAASQIFKNRAISDITSRDLENFLNKFPVRRQTKEGMQFTGKTRKITGRTRNNYRTTFCTLFSYARKMRYLARGVETESENMLVAADNQSSAERAAALEFRIYTPAQMQAILDGIPDRWIPFVALGAFAGIRSAEIHRMTWKDINFEDDFVSVDKFRAKVGRRRVVPMSAQLRAWLEPHARDNGWVCPHFGHDSTLSSEFAADRLKIQIPMIPNGHRHSYASYRLAETSEPARVAWEMNTSERKLRDNYLSVVNLKQVVVWKTVLPQPGRKPRRPPSGRSKKPRKHAAGLPQKTDN